MENSAIIIVLLTLITIIMTTVSVQLYRITDKMSKISDRLLIIETEHNNKKTNCANFDKELSEDLKKLIQDLRIYDELKKKEHETHGHS
jgi:predicted Holliday junction resolvase-like endonuclease